MPDVDTILREAGAAWRASRDVLPEYELPDFSGAQSLAPRFGMGQVVAASSVIVLLLVVAGGLFLRGARTDGSGVQPPDEAYLLRAGAQVTGTGSLVEDESGHVELCIGVSRLIGSPSCSVVAVETQGVTFESVPGAVRDGRWYAWNVTVRGTWTGTTVAVDSVSAARSTPPADFPNPCAADEGDGTALGTPAEESALRPLNDEVLGHPDRYGGLWRARSADGLGRIVVNVVGDTSAVEPTLRKAYPFPFCVVSVPFSEADLNAALATIGSYTPQWQAAVDYPRDRVIVYVGVLTEDVQRLLAPYSDRIVVSQLLRPA